MTSPRSEFNQFRSGQSLDYHSVQSIPEIWPLVAQHAADVVALHDPHANPVVKLTYRELYQQIQQFAAGLQALGIKPGEHVALFSENGPRWFIADQGILATGAANAVRGSQADRDELIFILGHSDSVALIVQDRETLQKIAADLQFLSLRVVILLSDEAPGSNAGFKLLNFSQVIESGKHHSLQPFSMNRNTLATLMYTSGTSGRPKGVMLSHGNLLSQISAAGTVVQPQPGERVLSILPIWHCYERTFEYFILAQGCTQIYTNVRHVKRDLKTYQPHYMVGVPRLWESIYEGIQKQFREQPPGKQQLIRFFLSQSDRYVKARRIVQGLSLDYLQPSGLERVGAIAQMVALWPLHWLGDRLVYRQVREGTGGQLKFVVSGGGSIAEHLEDFFEVVGIDILGGYGLTETAPITHVRCPERNLRGADGQPLPETETRIVDPETRQPLPTGQQGLILVRGPQVMQGYYKNPEATAKVIDSAGWFDTGDLGWVTAQDDLIITGRAKDTIVLSNGENIEPQPLENACIRSPYIDQIMLVGQDQRSLGALIVPNFEALQQWAIAQNYTLQLPESGPDLPTQTEAPPNAAIISLEDQPVQNLFRKELNQAVQNRPGYRPDDRIGPFRLLLEPFSIENGLLTRTLKIKRSVVSERYRDMIDGMFF